MGENKFNISDLLETHRRDRERLAWEGTFRDYFELVMQNPAVSKLSHARVCDMVLAAGVDTI
jgi:serine protein kinase